MSGAGKTDTPGWGGTKRFATGLNVSVSMLLAFVVFLMVNYLSAAHLFVRTDVSRARFYALSPKTTNMLARIEGKVSVYVLFRSTKPEDAETLKDTMNLLRAYEYFADRVDGLTFELECVDPDRDIARAETLVQRYGVEGADLVILDFDGRSKCVPKRHIVEYEYERSAMGIRPRRVAFNGEQLFSSALLSITQEQKPVVYFVRGHGEHDAADYAEQVGYSEIARSIRADNVEVRSISLIDQRGIRSDCDLLIIAGPRTPFHEAEAAVVREFLGRGCNVLLLADAGKNTGLEEVFEEWGVSLPTGSRVMEKTFLLDLGEDRVVSLPQTGEELYVRQYGSHPITAGLGEASTVFYVPRPVLPMSVVNGASAGHADRAQVTVLAMSSENSWEETDFGQDPPEYNPETDHAGPVPVAVAVEKGASADLNVELSPTRAVIIGDSDFAANGRLMGGNEDFFLSAVNWLLEREALMAIGPKRYDTVTLRMDEDQVRKAFMLIVVTVPAVIALLGFAVWIKRVR